MENEAWLASLEDKFLTYQELSSVPTQENGSPMVDLQKVGSVRVYVLDERMRDYTGDTIFVRSGVADRLSAAQSELTAFNPALFLEVVYGYRHLSIQCAIYQEIQEKLLKEKSFASEDDLKEAIHRSIAVPEVSGHPTGGAVDIRIVTSQGIPLPMGTSAHDFSTESYVFNPLIDKQAWLNRQLLRRCMTQAGFAPYDGEWWHFSYGDREWAKFYGKPSSLYNQIVFQTTKAKSSL